MLYKYTSTVQNKAAIDAGLLDTTIDVLDLIIVDYLQAFMASGKMDTKKDLEHTWFWVDYATVSNQLPLLRLKKEAIRKRFNKLVQEGLLEMHPDSQKRKEQRSFFRFTDTVFKMYFSEIPTPQKPDCGKKQGKKDTGTDIPDTGTTIPDTGTQIPVSEGDQVSSSLSHRYSDTCHTGTTIPV